VPRRALPHLHRHPPRHLSLRQGEPPDEVSLLSVAYRRDVDWE
jgi:hypothetical protein